VRAVRQLAEYFRQSPDTLSEAQVRDYFSHIKNERRFARGSLTIAYSGVKFFFRRTVPRRWKTLEHLRVPPQKKLPDVLTVEELRRIVGALRSEPCRVCLWTIYSLGLRLAEGVSLQVGLPAALGTRPRDLLPVDGASSSRSPGGWFGIGGPRNAASLCSPGLSQVSGAGFCGSFPRKCLPPLPLSLV
jgi:hypothetical protein